MNLLGYFRSQRKRSAKVAKERLQILVARERAGAHTGGPDYLPALQEELLDVIRKYVEVDRDAVQIQLEKEGDYDILELNITLPDSHR
ncbi:MAG: cell division topological specificity factor MinE [Ectothiorhodospiraceae bacterium]|nr:cell division topological specificity factor MinE [Ectothiorhodospiraceae bacterium]